MYTTAKNLSLLCAVLAAINCVAAALTIGWLSGMELGFTVFITFLMYFVSAAALSLFLCIALRSLLQDMELASSSQNNANKKLTDRVKELEKKLN